MVAWSGLGEEVLASEAIAADVHVWAVGEQAVAVPFADPEWLVGVLVEGVHDLLVGGALVMRAGPGSDIRCSACP